MSKSLLETLKEKYPNISEKEIKDIFHVGAQTTVGQIEIVMRADFCPAPLVFACATTALKANFSESTLNIISD